MGNGLRGQEARRPLGSSYVARVSREGSDPGGRSKGDERSIGLGINFEKAKETW